MYAPQYKEFFCLKAKNGLMKYFMGSGLRKGTKKGITVNLEPRSGTLWVQLNNIPATSTLVDQNHIVPLFLPDNPHVHMCSQCCGSRWNDRF